MFYKIRNIFVNVILNGIYEECYFIINEFMV
jgi:hypothetical protein